ELQATLLPIKLVCVIFTLFLLAAVIYFMLNSSWLQYKFIEDTTEFFSWQSYGMKQIEKKWAKIKGLIEYGNESEFKLAIIEADDFLNDILKEREYEGKDFQDSLKKASRLIGDNSSEILWAHEIRNTIVYNPDYSLGLEQIRKVLDIYESAINSIGLE
ncbi:MAG: hypothetical protein PHS54_06575, partial [Clostridia bacterium]|nr:hypothetical protein [Clostridia bacterium]